MEAERPIRRLLTKIQVRDDGGMDQIYSRGGEKK